MADFPTSIDNLIHYVEGRHQHGAPLDYLGEAMTVSSVLTDQADELLGHFVNRARRSGQSWTEIGARMGVSKQAVRKRFVPHWDGSDPIPQGKLFSRFTLYTRRALLVADAMARQAGTARIDASDMAAALLSEPDGLAAMIITDTGITSEDLHAALGTSVASCDTEPTAPRLQALQFTDDAMAALRCTHAATLRLGHNYVGTEHLLLGILSADSPTASTLTTLGVNAHLVERAINLEVARIEAERGLGQSETSQ
jgi:Clp amino terminal domain, pathogenicity island component